jgi:hypothetical protein
MKICSIQGCGQKHYGKGYCLKHYKRWIKGDDLFRTASKPSIAEPARFWSRAALTADESRCWNWQGVIFDSGYGSASVVIEGVKYQRAHRLAFFFANNQHPGESQVLHKCDNRRCVNPSHLFLGDHQMNMDDMAIKGRKAVGSKSGRNKLTENEVKQIRDLLGTGVTQKTVASQFHVSVSTISQISKGNYWKHVEVSK